MTPDNLDSLTDSALAEAVALECAGWTRSTFVHPMDKAPCDCFRAGDNSIQPWPTFATSADAILPLLPREPSGDYWACHAGYMGHRLVILGSTGGCIIAEGQADTFARAAALALVRAARGKLK